MALQTTNQAFTNRLLPRLLQLLGGGGVKARPGSGVVEERGGEGGHAAAQGLGGVLGPAD